MVVCRLFWGFSLLLPEGAEGNFFVFCRITSANACFFIIFWQTHHIFITSFSAALERCRKVKVLFGPSLFTRVGIVGIKSYFVHKKSIYAEKFVYFRRAESSNWRVAGESPRRLNKSRTKGFRWKYFQKIVFFLLQYKFVYVTRSARELQKRRNPSRRFGYKTYRILWFSKVCRV